MANPSEVAPSPSGRRSSSIGFFERVPIVPGSAVALLVVLVFAGWALDYPIITEWKPGGIPMIPLTALCFMLAGGSLILALQPHPSATAEAIQQTLAALVATIAI